MNLFSIVTIILMAYRIQAQTATPASGTESMPTTDSAQNSTSVDSPTAPGPASAPTGPDPASAPTASDAAPAPTAQNSPAGATAPNTVTLTQSNATNTPTEANVDDQGLNVGSKNAGGQGGSGKEPTPVPMTCEKGWMPVSKADLEAMANNGTSTEETQSQYSSVYNMAACQSANENVRGLCVLSSCDNGRPVCNTCSEMIFTSDTAVTNSNVTVDSIKCVNNYFFGVENGTVHNVCTDGNKAYSCTGTCTGYASCKLCASGNDTALQ